MKRFTAGIAVVVVTTGFLVAFANAQISSSTQPATECTILTLNLYQGLFNQRTAAEVIKLQKFLRSRGFTTVQVTAVYDDATVGGVTRFQQSVGITGPGVGGVGPITRAKIQQLTCGGSAFRFTVPFGLYAQNEQVLQLQKLLNSSTSTRIALVGPGSPGQETNYFGPGTQAALIKLQQQYSNRISERGYVGAKTITVLNELLLKQLPVPIATTTPATLTSTNQTNQSPTVPLGPHYTITASAGDGGTISPNGLVTVTPGSTKDFTVSANFGYQISSVTVDGQSLQIATTYSFTDIDADHTINATFSPAQIYTVTVSAGPHGLVTPSFQYVYSDGSVNISIVPDTGYQIDSITVDGVSQPISNHFVLQNVKGNRQVHVTFK